MPTRVPRIFRRRTPHRKCTHCGRLQPSLLAYQGIKRFVQRGRVRCLYERLLSIVVEPDYRFCPCGRIVWIAPRILPQYGPGLVGQIAREGTIQPDEPIFNKLLDLRAAQSGRVLIQWHYGSFNISPSLRRVFRSGGRAQSSIRT
ncbi:protein of unknown function [Candidatus Filomicrobium marinum]|uniref:Uncharacterized protein n=1 Tax=Candidatus Filomicrobium marinum TaxID=1608628 RepID=A0A0D6JDL1_9HYPH|nr:protein of unknown function [Candidatus Filomicrobium marinum]CPR17426.1 protein of unknown function [Candidatus Filomicrobium marinum]